MIVKKSFLLSMYEVLDELRLFIDKKINFLCSLFRLKHFKTYKGSRVKPRL
jgi:hypothetical protein